MTQEKSIHLNWNYAQKILPLTNLLEKDLPQLIQAKNSLLNRMGPSPEFTDWIPNIKSTIENILEKQKPIVEKIRKNTNAIVVVGVGGSLLGTKAIYEALSSRYLNINSQYLPLFWAGHQLDSSELLELCQTLDHYSPTIIVISKSGTTIEPALAFRVLRNYLEKRYSQEEIKNRIVAITDEKSGSLLKIAQQEKFETFTIPNGIGGRYSIFTSVGLFPLALAGFQVQEFVQGASDAYEKICHTNANSIENNPALCYAGIRNILYKNDYKIEALCSWTPKLSGINEWWKQLFGESDGKDGTGIFPASVNFTTDLHSMGQYFQDGERHLFSTHLKFLEEKDCIIPNSKVTDGFEYLAQKKLAFVQKNAQEGTFLAHTQGLVPTLVWEIPTLNSYWLGNWMFTNMFACALGGYARGIDPFNQPGVEQYKKNMFSLLNKER